MSTKYSIDDRLSFLGVDDDTRSSLQEFLPIVEKVLPEILDKFYNHVNQWPDIAKMFGNDAMTRRTVMAHARDAQTKHWKNLFSGRFDSSYVESVRKIGLTHSRIGLPPSLYIGGYSFTMNHIYKAIAHAFSSRLNPSYAQDKTARIMRAVNQAVMLDMDLAISIYIEENKNTYDRKLGDMVSEFQTSVGGVVESVASSAINIKTSATTMSSTAGKTTARTSSVAAATEQASANVQTVASATEELASSSREISNQMERTTRIAQQAVTDASSANATVDSLAQAAEKIGNVVEMIQEIAGQTNLLALNATIEAARAGEAGKGFAVVASEVKSLANQTAKATEEISAQITSMQDATRNTVTAIKSIGATIGEINEISTAVAAAVQEQTAATDEISRNVQQASQGTSEISRNISDVTHAATETGESAGQVMEQAEQLAVQSDNLQVAVEKFLTSLKAA